MSYIISLVLILTFFGFATWHMCMLSHFTHVQLFATLWTVAHQAPLLMGFSRQECWSRLPCPSPGDPPDPRIKAMSLRSPALAGGFFTSSVTCQACRLACKILIQDRTHTPCSQTWCPNHWTSRKVPLVLVFFFLVLVL